MRKVRVQLGIEIHGYAYVELPKEDADALVKHYLDNEDSSLDALPVDLDMMDIIDQLDIGTLEHCSIVKKPRSKK